MPRSPASCGSGERPQDLACPQVNRLQDCGMDRSPNSHPQTHNHTRDRFQKTHIYPYTQGGPSGHSSKAPLPKEPQVLGCPDQGNQPGKCGTKGRWRGRGRTRAGTRLKVMRLVSRGPPALGAKATGQTWRWDEPPHEDSDYSGNGGREEGTKLATASLFSPSSLEARDGSKCPQGRAGGNPRST